MSSEIRKGLVGVVADTTAISKVNPETNSLLYRGYPVQELAARCSFEEVAYLLWHGELPTPEQLAVMEEEGRAHRELAEHVRATVDLTPTTAHPMDVVRTAVSVIGATDPGADDRATDPAKAVRLLSQIPAAIAYDQRRRRGQQPVPPRADLGYTENFLHMTFGEVPAPVVVDEFRVSLILYAEHSFNASTFTARVITSTLSDLYSAVVGAVGALKGALHGGANEAVMQGFEEIGEASRAQEWLDAALAEKRKIMGFGHRVCKQGDSRVPTMKAALDRLAEHHGRLDLLERAMAERKGIKPNLDYPSGPVFHIIGFDTPTFTPLFRRRPGGWLDGAHHGAGRRQRAHPSVVRVLRAGGTSPSRLTEPKGRTRRSGQHARSYAAPSYDAAPRSERNSMLRIGYKASSEQFAPKELADYVVLAEQAGFESAFISDHFQPWRHDGGHAPASLPWLGAVGARTERIVLGTSVLTPTFRYHPAVIAQAFATLGCLFPGRIILGVGSGESLNEAALGISWPAGKERLARLREAVALIRELWAGERVNFQGEYYQTENATIYDRPEQQVPIYIGASGPIATRFAGREGDGFITTSGKAPELYTEKLLPALKKGTEQAGRTLGDLDLLMETKVSFDPDRARAMEDTRHWAALALSPEEKVGVEDPIEMQRLSDALPVERAASRWIVSDDPDEHVQQIQRYVDLGFRHLVFHAPGPDQARFIELYGEEIIPRLRKLTPASVA